MYTSVFSVFFFFFFCGGNVYDGVGEPTPKYDC